MLLLFCLLTTESITIILSDMAPFYEELCTDLKWPVDNSLLAKMQSNNEETFKKLDETLKDAEENLGETEIRKKKQENSNTTSVNKQRNVHIMTAIKLCELKV